MADIARSLLAAYDEVWTRFTDRLDGLGDTEYFWEPVPACWTVRRSPRGRWMVDGGAGDLTAGPPPDPPPVTTIAWRMVHIGTTFIGFGDRLFGAGNVSMADVDIPGSAGDAREFLAETYRGWWLDKLLKTEPAAWWEPLGPSFGPYSISTVADLALHVLDELIHHGAEIALLRDLYRAA